MQLSNQRCAVGSPDCQADIGRLCLHRALDAVNFVDQREHLIRFVRLGSLMNIEKFAPRVRPAICQRNRTAITTVVGQPVVASITIYL